MGARADRLRRAGLGLAFALLLAVSFPFRAGELRFDLGLFAGWLALVPFALGLRGLSTRGAFLWGTASGTLAYCGILFWIWVVVHVHGHAPGWLAVLGVIALAGAVGVHVGLAGALVAVLAPHAGALRLAVLPAAWVVCEHLRAFDLWSGFPWAYLGYAAHTNGPLLELAAFGGVWGLSFLLALFATLVSERRWTPALGLFAAAHLIGFVVRVSATPPAPAADPIWVGLVQANIPQEEKWDPELAHSAFTRHLEMSRLAAQAGPLDVLVWPEASVPVFLQTDEETRSGVQALARETGASLLVGGMAVEFGAAPREYRFFNSAFLLDREGAFIARYDKSRLVPFGEYVPWRGLLGALSGLATGIASGDVTPGSGPRALALPRLGAEHAVAPLICYEVIYPDLVRRAVLDGARVLVNITNDAWYGRTSAPHQFLAIAAMRSAEHGRPMLRAANTGVSAIVDAGGIVLRKTPIFERHALRAPLPSARPGLTPYARLGDWVVWGSWALLIALGIARGGAAVVARSRRRDARDPGSAPRAR